MEIQNLMYWIISGKIKGNRFIRQLSDCQSDKFQFEFIVEDK